MSKIEIKRYPDGIEIIQRWLGPRSIVAALGAAILLVPVIRDFSSGRLSGQGPGVWLSWGFAAVAAGVTYYAACGLANRSRIVVRQGRIAVSHGPLPTFFLVPGVALGTSSIRLLSVLRNRPNSGQIAPSSFDVFAVTHDKRSIRVVRGLDSPEEGEQIKKELEGHLARSSSSVR